MLKLMKKSYPSQTYGRTDPYYRKASLLIRNYFFRLLETEIPGTYVYNVQIGIDCDTDKVNPDLGKSNIISQQKLN